MKACYRPYGVAEAIFGRFFAEVGEILNLKKWAEA